MRVDQAQELLSTFKSQVSYGQIRERQFFQKQIDKLFVCSVINQEIVLNKTGIAWITSIVVPENIRCSPAQQLKVRQVFAEAIETLWQNKVALDDRFIRDLRWEFVQDQLIDSVDIDLSADFAELEAIKADKIRLEKEKINADSLFRQPLERFPKVFDVVDESCFTDSNRFLLEFIQKRPEFAAKGRFDKKIKMIEQALDDDKSLTDDCAQPDVKRDEILSDYGKKWKAKVRALKADERLICVGGYGVQINTYDIFSEKCRKLLPQFGVEELPDPKEFVEKSLQPFLDKMVESIPEFNASKNPHIEKLKKFLLYDPNKKISDRISNILPAFISEEINHLFQNGLMGCLIDFQEPGIPKQLLEWICLDSFRLSDPSQRAGLIKQYQNKLVEYGLNTIENPKEKIDYTVEMIVKRVLALLPHELLTIAGIDGDCSSGQLWLEIERKNNGMCTVWIYGSGNILSCFPKNANGEMAWPLQIQDVVYSRLDANFFQRFLFHHIEPKYNSQLAIPINDLFEGLLTYLKPGPFDEKAQNWIRVDPHIYTAEEMAQKILVNPQYSKERLKFELCFQLFVDYGRGLFNKDQEIVFTNDEQRELLKTICDKLLWEMNPLLAELGESRVKEIKATIDEVKNAIIEGMTRESKNRSTDSREIAIPEEILKPLQDVANAAGLTSGYLESIQELLCWLFGEKLRPLLNVLISILPVAHTSRLKKNEAPLFEGTALLEIKKWFTTEQSESAWQQKSKLIQLFSSIYVKMAYKALCVALPTISFLRSGISLWTFLPGISYYLRRYIPDWYYEVMARLKSTLAHLFLEFILRYLMPKKMHKAIQESVKGHLELAELIGNRLQGTEKLSYQIDRLPPTLGFTASFRTDAQTCLLQREISINNSSTIAIDLMIDQQLKVTSQNIMETVQDWIKKAKEHKKLPWQVFSFLLGCIQKLPLPEKDNNSLWDSIFCAEGMMEALIELSQQLVLIHCDIAPGVKFNTQYVIAQYKILAILRRLAEKSLPEEMKQQPVDITFLLLWVKDYPFIYRHDLWEELKKIVAYLNPDVDLLHLPDEKALREWGARSLFNYKQNETILRKCSKGLYSVSEGLYKLRNRMIEGAKGFTHLCQKKIEEPDIDLEGIKGWLKAIVSKSDNLNEKKDDFFYSSVDCQEMNKPEFLYYANLLKRPEAQAKLNDLGVESNADPLHQFAIIVYDSFNFKPQLVPKVIPLLRHQVLQNQSFKSVLASSLNPANYATLPEENQTPKLMPSCDFYNVKLFVPIAYRYTLNSTLNHTAKGKLIDSFALYNEMPREQVAIMVKPKIFGKGPNGTLAFLQKDKDLSKALEFSLCEPNCRVLRTLGYFLHHKEKLKQEENKLEMPLTSFLELVWMEIGQLEQQIIDSPHCVKALADFFQETIEYYTNLKPHLYTALWLILCGHFIQKYCRSVDSLNPYLQIFPDFSMKLEELGRIVEDPKHYVKLYHALVLEDNPHDLTLLKKKQGAVNLFGSMVELCGTTHYENDLLLLRFTRFFQWSSCIQELLLDKVNRAELICEVLKRRGRNISIQAYNDWKQISTWKYSCNDLTVDLNNGFIEENHNFFSDEHLKKNKLVVEALGCKISELALCQNGVWKTPDGIFKVRMQLQEVGTKIRDDGRIYHEIFLSDSLSLLLTDVAKFLDLSKYRFWLNLKSESILLQEIEKDFNTEIEVFLERLEPGKHFAIKMMFKGNMHHFDEAYVNLPLPDVNSGHTERYYGIEKQKVLKFVEYVLKQVPENRGKLPDHVAFEFTPLILRIRNLSNNSTFGQVAIAKAPQLGANIFYATHYIYYDNIAIDHFAISHNAAAHMPISQPIVKVLKKACLPTVVDTKQIHSREKASLEIVKMFQDKEFKYVSQLSTSIKDLLDFQGCQIQPDMRFWVHEEAHKRIVQVEFEENECYQERTLIFSHDSLVSYLENGIEKIKFKLTQLDHSLHSLARFCPLDEVKATILVKEKQLIELNFVPFQLLFSVEKRNGKLVAFNNEKFPGYIIAENQFHSALRAINTYLLLEGEGQTKRVLIPDGQWLSSAAWRVLEKGGALASFAGEYLQQLNKVFVQKLDTLLDKNSEGRYFEYEIITSELTSDDPESMAYLTLLYLLQGNRHKALTACQQLEKLGRRMHFPPSVATRLAPLALMLADIEEFRSIRMRLFSLLEENRLVHKVLEEEETSGSMEIGQNLLIGFVTLIDLDSLLRHPDPMRQLTKNQEWFLYRLVFRSLGVLIHHRIKSIVEKSNRMGQLLEFIENYGGDAVIEGIGLLPHLAQHYRELKDHFGFSDSLTMSAMHKFKQILWAPSLLPSAYSAKQIIEREAKNLADKAVASSMKGITSQWSRFVKLTRFCYANRRLEKKSLKLYELVKQVEYKAIIPEPPLKIANLNPEVFKKNLVAYYRIAKGEGTKDQQRKLMETLCLLKGGWEQTTQILVQYLEVVCYLPVLFSSTNKLVKAFELKHVDDFFDSWRLRVLIYQSVKEGLPILESYVNGNGISSCVYSKLYNSLPYIRNLPLGLVTDFFVTLGSKSVSALIQTRKQQPVQVSKNSTIEIDFEFMRNEDQQVDAMFKEIFEAIFCIENINEIPQTQMQTYKAPSRADPVLKARYIRVNTNITQYEEREERQQPLLRYRGQEKLWWGYVTLVNSHHRYSEALEARKTRLLDYLNSQIKNGSSFTIEQLEYIVLQGNYQTIMMTCQLQQEETRLIAQMILLCLVKETRLKQVNRALCLFDKLLEEKRRKPFAALLESLAVELQARRSYNKEIPSRLLTIYLLLEKKTDKLLWTSQVEFINRLLPEEAKDAVGELLMSLGKTTTIIPAYSAYEADGTKPIFVIYPKQIARTNIKTASDQAQEVLNQIVHGLMFSRAIPLQVSEIEALSVVFRSNDGVCSMTKEDMQALQLKMFDLMFQFKDLSHLQRTTSKQKIEAFRRVLRLTRESKGVADEAHEIFDCYKELNYPLGPRSIIKTIFYRIIEYCMNVLVADETFKKHIEQNTLPRLTLEEYQKILLPKIARGCALNPIFALHKRKTAEQNEFLGYVTGELKYIPDWIRKHPHFAEIAMLKGVLTVLLKSVIQKIIGVDFDAAQVVENGEQAKPAYGNNNVDEDSCIREPYEALVKTFFMLYCKGLNERQCMRLIGDLQLKAEAIAKKYQIPVSKTQYYKTFAKLVPTCAIFKTNKFSQEQRQTIVNEFGKNLQAINLYSRLYLHSQIHYWLLNLRSNSHNFASMFKSLTSNTGTPYNDGTYPKPCKVLFNKGTLGEAIFIIKQKCPQNGVHVLEKDKPIKVLQEILERFFGEKSDFTAIIDGGALLRGLSNESVAKAMLEHAKTHLPHIQAVKFFRKNVQGEDELVWWEMGADKPSTIQDQRIPPKNCLTLFDQPHGFAANIKQKEEGIGLVLVGEQELDQTLQRLTQDSFRMRGLKENNCVIIDDQIVQQTQSIQFAMTKAAQKKISGDAQPKLDDIIEFGIANEAARARADNYQAQIQIINNVVRTAVVDKILYAPSVSKAISIFFQFIDVLVLRLEDDPIKLYALIESKVPYKEALDAVAKAALKPIEKSWSFSSEEKAQIRQKIDEYANPPAETMPEEVTVYRDGKEIYCHLMDNLNKTTQVHQNTTEISGSQETENELENDQNLENEQNQNLTVHTSWLSSSYKEEKWPKNLDFRNNQWFQITKINDYYLQSMKSRILFRKRNDSLPFPLFHMRDLLENAYAEPIRKIAEAFDWRFWCSNNFIHRTGGILGNSVHPGDAFQCKLIEVLVHLDVKTDNTLNIKRFAPLTIKEGETWRNYLRQMSTDEKLNDDKIILFNMQSRVPVAGSHIDLDLLCNHVDFKLLEVMAHFIDGQKSYGECHLPILKDWLARNDVSHMNEGFKLIFSQRGNTSIDGCDIDLIFDELLHQVL